MGQNDVLQIVTLVIAVLALFLALYSLIIDFENNDDNETTEDLTGTTTAPTGALSFNENSPGNYTGGVISLSDELKYMDASVTIIDVSTSASASQDPLQSGSALQAGLGMTLTYSDSNGNLKVDAGDVWIISNGAYGDVVKLIHKTGKSIAQYTLQ